jgi:hypothetical protein
MFLILQDTINLQTFVVIADTLIHRKHRYLMLQIIWLTKAQRCQLLRCLWEAGTVVHICNMDSSFFA